MARPSPNTSSATARSTARGARNVLVQAGRALCLLHREGLVPRDLSAG